MSCNDDDEINKSDKDEEEEVAGSASSQQQQKLKFDDVTIEHRPCGFSGEYQFIVAL